MIEKFGEFFTEAANYHWDALICTTNTCLNNKNELVMGAGIARPFKHMFTNLSSEWGKRLKENYTDGLMCTKNFNITPYLIAFPTKRDWSEPSDLQLIIRNTKQLKLLTDIMGWEKVLMTRPGCGCGGLSWENQVKPLIRPYLDDRFTIINKD